MPMLCEKLLKGKYIIQNVANDALGARTNWSASKLYLLMIPGYVLCYQWSSLQLQAAA